RGTHFPADAQDHDRPVQPAHHLHQAVGRGAECILQRLDGLEPGREAAAGRGCASGGHGALMLNRYDAAHRTSSRWRSVILTVRVTGLPSISIVTWWGVRSMSLCLSRSLTPVPRSGPWSGCHSMGRTSACTSGTDSVPSALAAPSNTVSPV